MCNVSIRKGEYVCIGDSGIREDFINLSELRDSLFSTLAHVCLDNDLACNFNMGILPGLVSVKHAERSHFKYMLDMRFRLCCVYRFRAVLMHRYAAMIA